jgi:histidinol-phosphatase (PHP family)
MSNQTPTTIPPDYHSHSLLCKHAADRPIDYARAALARGVTEMACTEHAPAPEPFTPGIRMALDEFPTYCEWVQEAAALPGITVLLGIEADYYEGCEAFQAKWLTEQGFDYVMGSVHFLHYDRDNNHSVKGIWDSDDIEGYWTTYFERIGKLADTGLYDVAAHLDLPKKFKTKPPSAVIERLVKPALDRIAAANMGIEINTSGFIHEGREQYPSQAILTWACERAIPISFGSDSHHPDRIGADFEQAMQIARAAGYRQRAIYRQRQRTLVPL